MNVNYMYSDFAVHTQNVESWLSQISHFLRLKSATFDVVAWAFSISFNLELPFSQSGGTLDFRSEGQWFDAQSLPSGCFLRQETLPHIVSLHPDV